MTDQRPDLTQRGDTLVRKVLGDPTLYPDEFKTWVPRWVAQNVNFQLQATQLPKVQDNNLVGATGAAQFENAWENYGGQNEPALYYIDPFRRVHIGGVVKTGAPPSTIFTLPAGYRPQYAVIRPVASNDLFGVVTINSDGEVTANVGSSTYFSLSGISFRQHH